MKMLEFIKKDKSGFALAEVLVASAIMGTISLVIIKTMDNQAKMVKSTDTSDYINERANQLANYLSMSAVCGETFGDGVWNFSEAEALEKKSALRIDEIVNSNNEVLAAVDTNLKAGKPAYLTDLGVMSLKNIEGNSYEAELFMEFTKGGTQKDGSNNKVFGGATILKKKRITLSLNGKAGSDFSSCQVEGSLGAEDLDAQVASVCESLGGEYENGACNTKGIVCLGLGLKKDCHLTAAGDGTAVTASDCAPGFSLSGQHCVADSFGIGSNSNDEPVGFGGPTSFAANTGSDDDEEPISAFKAK